VDTNDNQTTPPETADATPTPGIASNAQEAPPGAPAQPPVAAEPDPAPKQRAPRKPRRVVPPEEVVSAVVKMLSERPSADYRGSLKLTTLNGYHLQVDKAKRLVDSVMAVVLRSHLVFVQETNATAMAFLASVTGWKMNVSHRNSRGQAVGFLYHPRLEPVGDVVYHDYLVKIDGRPEMEATLRPGVQRTVRDTRTDIVFTAINVHTKSNVGGPEATAPIRKEQMIKLVAEIERQGLTGPIVIAGDFNAPVNANTTAEIEPLLAAGFKLIVSKDGRETYPGGQFDAFFVRGFEDLPDDLWIPQFPEDKEERFAYREFSDHLPSMLQLNPAKSSPFAPKPKRRAIFLDRDGVINIGGKLQGPDDFKLIEGSAEAIAIFKALGLVVGCVTNQGGLGEGLFGEKIWKSAPLTRELLASIHAKMKSLLGPRAQLDFIKFCPHSKSVQCKCRKPGAEMLLEAASEHNLDLAISNMVGDMVSDVQAGINAGVTPIMVLSGFDPGEAKQAPAGTLVLPTLKDVALHILNEMAPVTELDVPALVSQIARPAGSKSIVLMVGIPASGKSTLVNPLEQAGYTRLSMDVIRGRLYGDEGKLGDSKLVNATFKADLKAALAEGKNIVVDNTNTRLAAREEILKAAAEAGYTDFQIVVMDVPLEECIRRNAARSRVVPEVGLRGMHKHLWTGGGLPTALEARVTFIAPVADKKFRVSLFRR
jgi:D-glycero-D-manno-heptose 1,7-bisphosphate phosphatase